MFKNTNLQKAKDAKNDEFYTQLKDIEKEVEYYRDEFKDKVVFMNCDDPTKSNFWFFFKSKFNEWSIKKLVSIHLEKDRNSYKIEYDKDNGETKTELIGNGDFRSEESIEELKKSDIVVTNPPFSLFREFVNQLVEYDKKFIILGSQNAVKYKEIFPLMKDGLINTGHFVGSMTFEVPKEYELMNKLNFRFDEDTNKAYQSLGNVIWFTNLKSSKEKEGIELVRSFNEEEYPYYDNYDAIEVSRVKDIPYNFDGIMGVPITFFNNYNKEQFEVIEKISDAKINGKTKYERIFIRKKNELHR